MDLFKQRNDKNEKKVLDLANAQVEYYPHFFTKEEADTYYQVLLETSKWQQDDITIFGKTMPIPRLQAWYGDPDKGYTYSGIKLIPHPWTTPLLEIKARIEAVAKVNFNSVLLNQYRTGKDSNGWHADDEKDLGQNPVIGSVSLGQERAFHFRNIKDKTQKAKLNLTHGSFLLMAGETQHYWHHQVPKTARKVETRINLTFRVVK